MSGKGHAVDSERGIRHRFGLETKLQHSTSPCILQKIPPLNSCKRYTINLLLTRIYQLIKHLLHHMLPSKKLCNDLHGVKHIGKDRVTGVTFTCILLHGYQTRHSMPRFSLIRGEDMDSIMKGCYLPLPTGVRSILKGYFNS